VKSLIALWQEVLADAGTMCRISTTLDGKTVQRRFEHEGVSFLTITLPNFCKDFEKSLDRGYVADDVFLSFQKHAGLPTLLSGFLQLVFERGSGRLLDCPSIDAIQAIRQVTMLCGKVLLECSDARVEAAFDKYIECEQEVRIHDSRRTAEQYGRFRRVSGLLWSGVLQNLDEEIHYGRLVPRHGPGATADRLRGNSKFDQREWTWRLEDGGFPSVDFLIPNQKHWRVLSDVSYLEPGAERPVKVISVPKTLKTPRLIAEEPTCMMYVQQAIWQFLKKAIESKKLSHGVQNVGYGLTGFTHQEPNQLLAREGSLRGELATLDLSEASDRVSNQLVREMVAQYPHVAKGIDACRSRKADVRGKGVVRLAKFASMGSALTFPMEAMVFTTVVFLGIEKALNRRLTLRDVLSLKGVVRVYGDDIIVPVDFVRSVVQELEAYGFKVNADKSFWTGRFRESCGKEYYAGEDVSIVRVRELLPSQRTDVQRHPERIISTVSLRNRFYLNGWWRTARYLDGILERLIPYPYVAQTSSALGRWSLTFGYDTERLHPELQSPQVMAFVEKSKIPTSILDSSGALLKVFLKEGDEPFQDERHLERQGRPAAVDIKRRWVSSF
jgi:hypothetical protein